MTHRSSRSFCSSESVLREWGGGITVSASVARIRFSSSLAFGSPGTIARRPLSSDMLAPSAVSRRNPASCFPGPWQLRQFSARIGRMSWSKRRAAGSAAVAAVISPPASQANVMATHRQRTPAIGESSA